MCNADLKHRVHAYEMDIKIYVQVDMYSGEEMEEKRNSSEKSPLSAMCTVCKYSILCL